MKLGYFDELCIILESEKVTSGDYILEEMQASFSVLDFPLVYLHNKHLCSH